MDEEITFRAIGPFQRAELDDAGAAALREMFTQKDCPWCWGSHACGMPFGHEGNHACIDEDEGEPHDEVDQEGYDEGGFKWHLYGGDPPP